jgi:hypothetical protein
MRCGAKTQWQREVEAQIEAPFHSANDPDEGGPDVVSASACSDKASRESERGIVSLASLIVADRLTSPVVRRSAACSNQHTLQALKFWGSLRHRCAHAGFANRSLAPRVRVRIECR